MKNIKNVSMKLSFAALTAAMAAAPALNVFAAPEDIIDQNAKASLTIHKYDTTLYDKVAKENNPNKEVIEENLDRASATVDGNATNMKSVNTMKENKAIVSTNARVEMSVTNTPGFELPATGGAGTIVCTVAGCTIAFAGVVVLTRKSKKDNKYNQ